MAKSAVFATQRQEQRIHRAGTTSSTRGADSFLWVVDDSVASAECRRAGPAAGACFPPVPTSSTECLCGTSLVWKETLAREAGGQERWGGPSLDGGRGGCGGRGLLLPLVLLALAERLPLLGHQRHGLRRRLLQDTTTLMAQSRDGFSGWMHDIIAHDSDTRSAELERQRHSAAVFRPASLDGQWEVRPRTAQKTEVLGGSRVRCRGMQSIVRSAEQPQMETRGHCSTDWRRAG